MNKNATEWKPSIRQGGSAEEEGEHDVDNDDWLATSVIYEGVPKWTMRLVGKSAGFIGSIEIPISALGKTAFFRRVSKNDGVGSGPHFRYFSARSSGPAVLRIDFDYRDGSVDDGASDGPKLGSSTLPSSVRFELKEFPWDLLPAGDGIAAAFLDFLSEECGRRFSSTGCDFTDLESSSITFPMPSSLPPSPIAANSTPRGLSSTILWRGAINPLAFISMPRIV